MAEIFKLLNSPLMKQLKPTMDLLKAVLPAFKVEQVSVEGKSFAAVLFNHDEENKRRVEAIQAIFEDILPKFEAVTDFSLDGEMFAALLFEVQEGKQ